MNVDTWWRWWAIAAIAHVVGGPTVDGWAGRGLANTIVGLVAIAVIVDPAGRGRRTALAAVVVVSAIVEAPLIGNHWWVAAAVSVAALVARPWQSDNDAFARSFAPSARLILLVFYSFAAWAKLNSGFLDPAESCARFFANQALSFWRLPEVAGDAGAAPVLPLIALMVELAVPVLLVVRPTRRAGVWLAVVFHLALTVDLRQHFYDFTLVLVPLFSLFAPPSFLEAIDRAMPRLRIGGGRPWMAAAGVIVIAFHLPAFGPLESGLRTVAIRVVWAIWVFMLVLIGRGLVAAWRGGHDRPTATIGLRPSGLGGAAIAGIVLLNGLSPYLELKTATGFNMYANLVTANGESNHLVFTRTAGLRDQQARTVEILASDDDGLAAYVDAGFALPVINLRNYLADHPKVSVTYRLDGVVAEHRPDAPGPLVPESMSWFAEQFALFRAVPLADPPACQNVWYPAR